MKIPSPMKVIVAVIAFCGVGTTAAFASPTEVINEVDHAAKAVGVKPAKGVAGIQDIDGNVIVGSSDGMQLVVVADNAERTKDGVVADLTGSAKAVFQRVSEDSYRTSVLINKPSDPERYSFNMPGVARLEQQVDGSVSALNSDGQLVATIDKAWARDGDGRKVTTRYEINGSTLTQVVEHRDHGFTYGIVADPAFQRKWWGMRIALNAADVAGVAATGVGGFGVWASRHIPDLRVRAAVIMVGLAFVGACNAAHRNHRLVVWHVTWTGHSWATYPRR